MIRLSSGYTADYLDLLGRIGEASTPDARLTPFWPLSGQRYDGELMVIGRSVNGWIDDWLASDFREPLARAAVAEAMRTDAEPSDRCRMLWVTDLAGRTENPYNTNRSAFWRVLRALMFVAHEDPAHRLVWPSFLTWTNLYKVSPAAGWNPGADLQVAQRGLAIRLLQREVHEYRPKRVLALTGGWIRPFEDDLGLELTWDSGLVEATGRRNRTPWVVAKHPMGKPAELFVAEVLEAFKALGAPLERPDNGA
jgi:hypothetical protein